ncbi:cupin domain-containing protein [Patescibacteria group bacterium]
MIVRKLNEAGRVLPKEKTQRMKSGYVILSPEEEIGEHITEQREELIIFLEGKAKVISAGKEVEVKAPVAVYIEPEDKHNVINIGKEKLKYVYVVAFV